MVKRIQYSLLLLPFLLSGCDDLLSPDAPPSPPLPTVSKVSPISTEDIPALQMMSERALFVQKIVSLAATHSDHDFVKQFATQTGDMYKKHQEAMTKIVQSAQISLPKTLNKNNQQRVDVLSRLYSKEFDRALLRNIAQPFTKNEQAILNNIKQKGSTDDLKKLAEAALQLSHDVSQNARDRLKY